MESTAPTDDERLRQLILAEHPAIAISTFEETYVMEMLRRLAIDAGTEGGDLWIWSVSRGIRDGLVEGGPSVADTEHPAAALYYLVQQKEKTGTFVFLDLAGHLKDERTLRMLREAIASMPGGKARIVLVDK